MSNADNSHTEKLRRLRQTTQAIFRKRALARGIATGFYNREEGPGGVVEESVHLSTRLGGNAYTVQKAEAGPENGLAVTTTPPPCCDNSSCYVFLLDSNTNPFHIGIDGSNIYFDVGFYRPINLSISFSLTNISPSGIFFVTTPFATGSNPASNFIRINHQGQVMSSTTLTLTVSYTCQNQGRQIIERTYTLTPPS